MDTAAIPHITGGLPWETCPAAASAEDRQRIARTFAALRRDGADAHYAWLAALDACKQASTDPGDWAPRKTAVR